MNAFTSAQPYRQLLGRLLDRVFIDLVIVIGCVVIVSCTREESAKPLDATPSHESDSSRSSEEWEKTSAVGVDQIVPRNEFLTDWRTHFDLGNHFISTDTNTALAHFERAAELTSVPREIAAARFAAGAAYVENCKPELGEHSIRLAINDNPALYVKSLYWLGRARILQNKSRAAAALLDAYCQANPLDADAAFWQGRALYMQGAVDAARDRFARAATEYPDVAVYHHWLGKADALRLDYQNAIESLEKAIELDPAHPDNYWSLAQLYVINGDFDSAAEYTGDLWLVANERDRAGELLDTIKRVAGSRLVVRRHVGRFQFARARFDEAVELLQSVVDDDDANATDYAYLGWAQLSTGEYTGAETSFSTALAENSNHAFAGEGQCWLELLRGGSPTPNWEQLESSAASPTRVRTARHWASLRSNSSEEKDERIGKFTGMGAAGFWREGLLVLAVLEGSPAHALGIRPGDLITDIDGIVLDGERDWDAVLGQANIGDAAIVSWVSGEEECTRIATFAGAA